MRIDYAIVFVSDMTRSIDFYRDVVGIPLKFDSPEWTEFQTAGATLALHKGEPRSEEGAPASTTAAGQCHPGFAVDDLGAFHARMTAHGVEVVREPKEEFGVKIAQYLDPDGVAFSVSEIRPGGE